MAAPVRSCNSRCPARKHEESLGFPWSLPGDFLYDRHTHVWECVGGTTGRGRCCWRGRAGGPWDAPPEWRRQKAVCIPYSRRCLSLTPSVSPGAGGAPPAQLTGHLRCAALTCLLDGAELPGVRAARAHKGPVLLKFSRCSTIPFDDLLTV